MREYLSLWDIFDKENSYYIVTNLYSDAFHFIDSKLSFKKYMDTVFIKFKIKKFQNDRKANVFIKMRKNNKLSLETAVITLSKFKKTNFLKGENPYIVFWFNSEYKYSIEKLDKIVKSKKELYKFALKNYYFTNHQVKWLKEYCEIKDYEKNKIHIKFKKI